MSYTLIKLEKFQKKPAATPHKNGRLKMNTASLELKKKSVHNIMFGLTSLLFSACKDIYHKV